MASGSSFAITVTSLRSHFSHDWLTLLHWIHSGYKYFRYLNNGTLSKNSFTLLKFFARQMFERQMTIWDDAEVLNKRLTNASWAPLSTVNNFILLEMEVCFQVVNYLKIYFWGGKNNEVDILLIKKIFELYFESTPQNWPGSIQEPVFHWVLRHSGQRLIRLPAPQSSILLSHCMRGWEDFATKFNVTFGLKI